MMNLIIVLFGKLFSLVSKLLNLGNGSTWPGHIALKLNRNFIKQMLGNKKMTIILVAGTNGKTTTAKLIEAILDKNGQTVIQNPSGANLLNGIASGIIQASSITGKLDASAAVFEVDENALQRVLTEVTPRYLVLINLFRDQLDRYGEVHTVAKKWKQAIEKLSPETTLILNADDPQIAYIGKDATASTAYFGLDQSGHDVTDENTADSSYCPQCGERLSYKAQYFSHIGNWHCLHCKFKRPALNLSKSPNYPLEGEYNKYNTLAAVLVTKTMRISEKEIVKALESFKPAFGRQEKLTMNNKSIQLFLSKNPTGFNESIKTIQKLGAKYVLLILNDNIADGRDISWIWDIETDGLVRFTKYIATSGIRAFDMGLRVKYSFETEKESQDLFIDPDIANAILTSLKDLPSSETLYILPTYTAMLEARKVITGKEIL